MAPTDPHQGGDLFGMAQKGTTMPNDAGEMNIIPSKPSPGETLQGGPTNPTDIPRSFQDQGAEDEVQTGTGYMILAPANAAEVKQVLTLLSIQERIAL
jgi:hypothetical protein